MDANSYQVGGQHYKTAYEHWDLVLATGMDYLAGCATKYVSRWRKKNGVDDLKKALHYVQKLSESAEEVEPPGVRQSIGQSSFEVAEFARINDLSGAEHSIINTLATWLTSPQLVTVEAEIEALIAEAERARPSLETRADQPDTSFQADDQDGNKHDKQEGDIGW